MVASPHRPTLTPEEQRIWQRAEAYGRQCAKVETSFVWIALIALVGVAFAIGRWVA